jgi:hypothetical protein
MNERDRRMMYVSIFNFEVAAAFFFWPSNRPLAWWMIFSAVATVRNDWVAFREAKKKPLT